MTLLAIPSIYLAICLSRRRCIVMSVSRKPAFNDGKTTLGCAYLYSLYRTRIALRPGSETLPERFLPIAFR
jgi:hypothetical protein